MSIPDKKKIIARHKHYWARKDFYFSFILSAIFFAGSLVFNHLIAAYVDSSAGAYVQDILLDNLPVMNVDLILNDGVIIFGLFIIVFALIHPKKIPFLLKSVAFFIFIRAIFTTLTHMGPAPSRTYLDPDDLLIRLNAGSDMFFSGHTGMPFLLALIFWENKIVRYVSLGASLVFGSAVLLGHLHYSIDVFAAFFIAYSIFHICQRIFPGDYRLLKEKTD